MSDYFLGVDGGQSSTTAVIGDERGGIAGWASAGPCNHVAAHEAQAKFRSVMRDCVSQAAARAGLDPAKPRFRAACLGMSGGPDDKAALLAELIDAAHLVVTHDAAIALAGATAGEPGIITIAGTGSMAFEKTPAAKRRGRVAGDTFSATKAARSTWSGRLCGRCCASTRAGADGRR